MIPAGGGGAMALGAKGEVRNPITVALLGFVTCGGYFLYWYYFQVLPELKAYLGKSDEEVNPTRELLLGLVTCGIFYLLSLLKTGKLIQEAQARSGRPNPEDKGMLFLILALVFGYAVPFMVQTELNRVWDPSLP